MTGQPPQPLPRRSPPNPAVAVVLGFMGAILLGTCLLALPVSRAQPGPVDWMAALFTATSALCVTGLTVVDTGTYWSDFGHVLLVLFFQIGGFGIMTSATLLGLWAGQKMRLRARVQLQAETRALALGDARRVVRLVWAITFGIELLAAIWLTLRFALGYDMSWPKAAWYGVFHAVSAFNNAGFSPFSDNMAGFSTDGWILTPLMLCVVLGGIGFPVFFELWQRFVHRWKHRRGLLRRQPEAPLARPRVERLSLHASMTLWGTALLLLAGTVGLAAVEWFNPATLGPMAWPEKMLNALFTSVVARTAGFNSIDLSQLQTESYVLHYLLMFIGAGSAGTGGGVKIATFAVLLTAVWSQLRGSADTEFGDRRIAPEVLIQALTVMVMSSALIGVAMMALVPLAEGIAYEHLMFEAVSAFATVGVSAGITAKLPPAGQFILILLMFLGRVGVVTLGVALMLRQRPRLVRFPEEKPLVG